MDGIKRALKWNTRAFLFFFSFFFSSFFLFSFTHCFFISYGNFWSSNLAKAHQYKSGATHSDQRVQYLRVSKQSCGCQCLGFVTCARMLMHVSVHGGCTDIIIKTFHWKLTLGVNPLP